MGHQVSQHMGARDWGLLTLLSFCWGSTFYFSKVALEALSPLVLVWLRLGLGAALMWLLVLVLGRPVPPLKRLLGPAGTMGLLQTLVPFVLGAWGLVGVSASLASILNATTPLWTVLIAGLFLADEGLTRARVLGVVAGFGGIVLIAGDAAFEGAGGALAYQAALVAATLCYGIAGVYGRRFAARGVDAMVTGAAMLTAAAVMLTPFIFLFEAPVEAVMAANSVVWFAVVSIASMSTALAFWIYFALLARVGATNVSLVTFLVPVTAIFLGMSLLGERLALNQMLGMAMIAVGLMIVDGRVWARWRSRP